MLATRNMNQMTVTAAAAAMFATLGLATAAPAALVDLWRFDNSGNVGQATVGTNVSTNGNAAYTAGGHTGGGLALDGAGDFLSGAPTLPTGDSSYTVSGWINTAVAANMGIVGWGNYGSSGQVNATRTAGATDVLNYGWGGANDLQANSLTTINNSTWHHVVATYDAASGVKQLYVNGNAVGAKTVPNLNVSGANFRIGSTNFGEYFNGTIDDVAIYNEAIDARDVRLVGTGNFAAAIAPSTLAHRYSFTTDATDSVGGAHLTVTGTATAGGGVLDLPGGAARTNSARATGAALTTLANTINSADSITIESWFNADVLQNWSKLFMAGTDTNTYMDITPRRGDNALASSAINDTAHTENNVQSGAGSAIVANTEYYVSATWRGSANELSILIRTADGSVVARYEEAGMGVQSLAAVAMNQLYIGSAVGFGDSDFDGQVDEFRIWSKAISQARSLANLSDGPDYVNTGARILIDEDWEGNTQTGATFFGYGVGAPITGTSAVVIGNFTGATGQTQVEIANNDTAAPGGAAIFHGRSVDLNQFGVEFAFSLTENNLLDLFVEYGSPTDNGPTSGLEWRVLNAINQIVAGGTTSAVSPGQVGILATSFWLGLGDYRLQLGSDVATGLSGVHIDGVFLRATVPTPAALPAGLALLALAAARRRGRN